MKKLRVVLKQQNKADAKFLRFTATVIFFFSKALKKNKKHNQLKTPAIAQAQTAYNYGMCAQQ